MRVATAADLFLMREVCRIRDAKNSTRTNGKDAAVIDYLSRQASVHQYLSSVLSLVDATVSGYQKRGFKHLMSRLVVQVDSTDRCIWPSSWPSICAQWSGCSVAAYRSGKDGPMKAMILAAGLARGCDR